MVATTRPFRRRPAPGIAKDLAGLLLCMLAALAPALALAAGATPATETAKAPPPLRIAVIQKSGTQEVAAKMLTVVYERAGVPMRLVPLPAARATLMSDHGEVDGEAARIPTYYAERPDLVVVEPALMVTDSVVCMRRASARPIVGVADLAGLRVGMVRGVRQSLEALAGHGRVEQVTYARQLYQMLDGERLDAVVDSTVNRRLYTAELGLVDVVEAGTLSRQPVFHALHRRHAAMARRIGRTLAAMKASGELARLQARAEREASQPRRAGPRH